MFGHRDVNKNILASELRKRRINLNMYSKYALKIYGPVFYTIRMFILLRCVVVLWLFKNIFKLSFLKTTYNYYIRLHLVIEFFKSINSCPTNCLDVYHKLDNLNFKNTIGPK